MAVTSKMCAITSCFAASALMHLILAETAGMLAHYDFAPAVSRSAAVMVDLTTLHKGSQTPSPSRRSNVRHLPALDKALPDSTDDATESEVGTVRPGVEATGATAPELPEAQTETPQTSLNATQSPAMHPAPAPKLAAEDFVASSYEKLSYLVSMRGIPVGNAELEARKAKDSVTITLRMKSNQVLSTLYPVDDFVQTRHVGGRYIMTNIKQHEGAFHAEEQMVINLHKKTVQWDDLVGSRNKQMALPGDSTLDTLSGIYYLRTRRLEVGEPVTLQIYDSESYAEVPVDVLRREKIVLANGSAVQCLVVRPLQKTTGIFRRTGDIQIWFSDDEKKVPLKIVTTIALGTVTAELVGAESNLPAADGSKP